VHFPDALGLRLDRFRALVGEGAQHDESRHREPPGRGRAEYVRTRTRSQSRIARITGMTSRAAMHRGAYPSADNKALPEAERRTQKTQITQMTQKGRAAIALSSQEQLVLRTTVSA